MTEQSLPKLDWQVVVNRKAPDGVRGWGRVRAAQLHEMGRAMEIAAWGQTFNALLICYLLAGRAPSPLIAAWLLGLALLMIYIVQNKRKLRGRQIHSLPRKTLNRAAYHTVFFGTVWSIELKIATMGAERAQPSERLSPFSMLSGLSRRSTSIIASSGLTATVTLMVAPSGGVAGKGSWVLVRVTVPLGMARMVSIIRFSL